MIGVPIKSREIVGDKKIRFFLFDKSSNKHTQFLLFSVQFAITKVFLDEPGDAKDSCHCPGFSRSNIFEASVACCVRDSPFSFSQKHQRYCTPGCREMM